MGREWTGRELLTEKIDLAELEQITKECGYVLAGKHPAMQGMAIADLLLLHLRGYDATKQQQVFLWIIKQVQEQLD